MASGPDHIRLSLSYGYKPPLSDPGGLKRPYLWLELSGPNNQQWPVRGLIDTGADVTTLPEVYATLMGLNPNEFELGRGGQLSGTFQTMVWDVEINAVVVGVPQRTFKLKPIYVRGSFDPVWGRRDFMHVWDLFLSESEQTFRLHDP